MKRHLLRSVCALATACTLFLLVTGAAAGVATGSRGWQWLNPLPQGNDYSAGYFLNATHGWLTAGGDIFHTTNGGRTLTVQARHDVTFKAITFVGARYGWAVGYPAAPKGKAVIYRTRNGGASWLRVPVALAGGVRHVSFSGPSIGWATSGRAALHSIDGGRHWTVHLMARHDSLSAVQTLNARVAWIAAGGDTLLRTTSGGATWKRLRTGVADHISLLCFTSLKQGWVAGRGTIAHTSDGGAHWSVQLSIKPTFSALSFADASDGWAAAGGAVYRTTDGGAHWVRQTSAPFATWIAGLKPAGAAVLAGPISGGSGGLAYTSDGGATWHETTRTPAGSADLAGLQFLNATTGWAAGAGGAIIKTTNGGSTWAAQSSGTTADLNDLHFIDAANGWAVGDQGVVAHSTNGGATWAAQASGVNGALLGVSFADGRHGWAVGHTPATVFVIPGPVILATTDGGAHWGAQTAPLPAEAELFGVTFADATHGWAVGTLPGDGQRNASVIVATTDGGVTWKRQLTHYPPQVQNVTSAVLNAVACRDARHAIAVGSDDVGCEIFRTSNGGATWTGLSQAARARLGYLNLSDIALAGASRAWAVGDGTVLETTDGGVSWRRQSVGAPVDAVSFVSPTRGWVAGAGADILTTTTAGNAP
jgi:photosystem II stability/assembly factor-like uncharacterized protein